MSVLRNVALPALLLVGCTGNGESIEANRSTTGGDGGQATGGATETQIVSGAASEQATFEARPVADFNEPWAMTFLPGGRHALITEKPGRLKLWRVGGEEVVEVAGVPAVDYGGQGGLGDVVLHPRFASNNLVYLSYAEAGEGDTRGAAVGRGRLVLDGGRPRLQGFEVIWRQQPKVTGRGHYAHRMAFSPDGHLFISSGDRQKMEPAQDLSNTLGTIVRLNDDGSVPTGNPFAERGGVSAQIWSYGHRNPLGLAFDAAGNLWSHEMGPRHGDEFNRILPGRNYGWPQVSYGDHYDGEAIPDHQAGGEYQSPHVAWVPAISPAGMIVYSGDMFPQWRGSALLGGLSGQVLARVAIDGTDARAVERWDIGARIREVEQGPDGAVYVLEDERGESQGRLLRLTPRR